MKKKVMSAFMAALLCLTAVTTPSCIGSFGLSNRLLGWNQNVGNKFVNELVFFAFWILPVYEVSLLADVIVLNSIEFWSGSNPMASGEKVLETKDGRYLVKADKDGYDIMGLDDNTKIRLDYDADENSWNVTANGETHMLFAFVDDTHVRVPVGASEYRTVELSEAGVYAYQQMIGAENMAVR